MSITIYIPTDPTYYGPECCTTDEDGDRAARIIMQRAKEEFPDVDFEFGSKSADWGTKEDLEQVEYISQVMTDNFGRWIADAE